MLKEFELEVIEAEAPELGNFWNFENPIAYFTTDADKDPYRIFSCAVIVDHRQGKISVWSPRTAENQESAEGFFRSPGLVFEHAKNGQDAHCFIPCPDGTYLSFFEKSSLGVRLDPKRGKMSVFDVTEAFGKESWARNFCVTSYANPDPSADFFHTSFSGTDSEGRHFVKNAELAYDFSYWKEIRVEFGSGDGMIHAPHMTRVHGGRVYDSHFKDATYSVRGSSGATFGRHELVDGGMRKIFSMFKTVARLPDSEPFERFCATEDGWVKFSDPTFFQFCEKMKSSFGLSELSDLICEKITPGLELLPGKISHFGLSSPETADIAETSCGAPAHLEFLDDSAYVSSHNFDTLCWGIRYFWPAAIDALKIHEDGRLTKTGTFTTEKWYRFTSHRAFRNEKGTFVATIGQPNRFYVVDATNMEEVFHTDLATKGVSDCPIGHDVPKWMRSTHTDGRYLYFRPFEVSSDGRTAFVPNRYGFRYVDLTDSKIPQKSFGFENLPLPLSSFLPDQWALSAHCYELRGALAAKTAERIDSR